MSWMVDGLMDWIEESKARTWVKARKDMGMGKGHIRTSKFHDYEISRRDLYIVTEAAAAVEGSRED
jgi:hypothetical protein